MDGRRLASSTRIQDKGEPMSGRLDCSRWSALMDDLRTFLIGSDSFGGEEPAICIPISSVTDSDICRSGDWQKRANRPPREKPKNSEASVPAESYGFRGQESGAAPPVQKLPKVSAKLMARYDRVRLYEDVWVAPLKNVAEKLGISLKTLAEVCKKLRIPLPDKGHWNKLAAGKPVGDRPTLEAVHFVSSNSPKSQRISGKNPATVSGRLMERYNREELYEDAWKFPFTQLEFKWGTSASTLSQICKALRIPVPGVGYWNKIAAGKPVPARSPLPAVTADPRFLTRKRFSIQYSAPAEASNANLISGETACGNYGTEAEKSSATPGQVLTISNAPDFISDVLNEMSDNRSIVDGGNPDGEQGSGISHKPPLTASGAGEHILLDSEIDGTIFVSNSDLGSIAALNARKVSSPAIHSDSVRENPTISEDIPTVAHPQEESIRGVRKNLLTDYRVQEAASVPGRSMTKYDRNRLYEEVWKTPTRTLAGQYGVSNVALRKTCCRLGVPTPPRGHWSKVAAGRPVDQRPVLLPLQIPDSRQNGVYSAGVRNSILAQIARDISAGATLSAACRKVGIMEKTYRRWYRPKSALVASDELGIEPEEAKTDQACSTSGNIDSGSQNPISSPQLQVSPDVTGTGSYPSAHTGLRECQEGERRLSCDFELSDANDPAITVHCESQPLPRVSAKLLRIHDRKELYERVWSTSMSEIAKEDGVSIATISRRCKQLHVPVPTGGHWRRLETGLPVQRRPPLPMIQIVDEEKGEWKSNVYSSEEIIRISQCISDAVLAGNTLEDACRQQGIAITTYRRWRKRLPQSADGVASTSHSHETVGNKRMRKRGFRHQAEDIANLDREIEAALRSGRPLYVALLEANISQSTYYRWRKDCA